MSSRRVLLVLPLLIVALGIAVWQYGRYYQARADLTAAQVELSRFNYDAAAAHARRAAAYWPRRGDVRLLAAQALRRAGHSDEAAKHLEAARECLGDVDEIRFEQQLLTAQQGEATEFAEIALQQRMRLEPARRTLILEAIARGAMATFRLSRARAILDDWLHDPSNDPRPYMWRATVQEEMGEMTDDQVVADYNRVLQLDPGNDEARTQLASVYMNRKDPQAALPLWTDLQRRNSDTPKYCVGLAQCRLLLGDVEAARGLLERALQLDPDNVVALRESGVLALNENRFAEAESRLRRAYNLMPNDPFVSYYFQTCLFKLGLDEEARKQQARHDELSAKLARLLQLVRSDAQARPNDPELLHEIATIYLKYGTPDQEGLGVWWLQRALNASPGHAPTLLSLAEYFDRKGRADLAGKFRARARR